MSQSNQQTVRFWNILSMNIGFFGIQYSFGLQQTNMTPIYSYLGADPEQIPLLNLAGPMTGLLVQPIVGALSDKTISRFGRRRPYFMLGAILCSICLLWMPFSSSLWMAVGLLWVLDAANNITMEPYRAFISDVLPEKQHATGFLAQSFFTGLGITLANLTPSILVGFGLLSMDARNNNNIPYTTMAAFIIGAVVSIASVTYSVFSTPEPALTTNEIAAIRARKNNIRNLLSDIGLAITHMPSLMRQLALVYLFNWYAIFIYWQFITLSLAKTLFHTTLPTDPGFAQAQLLTGRLNGGYNIVTFCVAFLLAWLAKKTMPKQIHAMSLFFAGIGLFSIPFIQNTTFLLWPMLGLGIGWASMMGTPYVLLAGSIPKEKTGIYMGILNMFIVLPMMLETLTFRWVYKHALNSDPNMALHFAGILFGLAALFTLFLKNKNRL